MKDRLCGHIGCSVYLYKRACEVGGAIFVPMALTPYGGWHKEDKDLAESWTRKTTHKTTHTGDGEGYYEFDQRFEHPGRQ